MSKKVLLGFIVVFVILEILDFIVHGVILDSTYKSLENVWRLDMKPYIFHLTTLVFSFFFAFIFSKGYESRGLAEGFRYGLYIGLMIWIPASYNQYATYPVAHSLALQWLIFGVISYVIAGIFLAMVFGGKKQEAAA